MNGYWLLNTRRNAVTMSCQHLGARCQHESEIGTHRQNKHAQQKAAGKQCHVLEYQFKLSKELNGQRVGQETNAGLSLEL